MKDFNDALTQKVTIAMAGLYFEDFNVGDEFVTPRRTITETDVVNFAGLSGDFNPIHTDRVLAAESPFGERIAHGLLVMSIATGLTARLGIFDGTVIALLGIEEWRFQKPVLFGDTIHVRLTIVDKRTTSHEDRGIVRRKMDVLNQRGDLIQTGIITTMCRRRPASAPR